MNGADVAHLSALHSGFVVPWLGWALSHTWAATWTARTAAGERHLADIAIDEAVALFGVELPGKVRVKILQAGPSQVFLRMQTPVGPIFVIETVTPVSPLEQRTLHALYVPPWFPTVAGKAILAATLRQYEKDVPVWTSKVYKRQPMLSSADKAVASYLRWINQFSNPASITFEEAAKAHARDMAGLPSALAW
jgi:cholesterol 7-dehydrogenase